MLVTPKLFAVSLGKREVLCACALPCARQRFDRLANRVWRARNEHKEQTIGSAASVNAVLQPYGCAVIPQQLSNVGQFVALAVSEMVYTENTSCL